MPCGCCCAPTPQRHAIQTNASLHHFVSTVAEHQRTPRNGVTYYSYAITVKGESVQPITNSGRSTSLGIKLDSLSFQELTLTDDIIQAFSDASWEKSAKLTIGTDVFVLTSLANILKSAPSSIMLGRILNPATIIIQLSQLITMKRIWLTNLKKSIHLHSRFASLTAVHLHEKLEEPFNIYEVDKLLKALSYVKTLLRVVYKTVPVTGFIFRDCFNCTPAGIPSDKTSLSFTVNSMTKEILKLPPNLQDGLYLHIRFEQQSSKLEQLLKFLKTEYKHFDLTIGWMQLYSLAENAFLMNRIKDFTNPPLL